MYANSLTYFVMKFIYWERKGNFKRNDNLANNVRSVIYKIHYHIIKAPKASDDCPKNISTTNSSSAVYYKNRVHGKSRVYLMN